MLQYQLGGNDLQIWVEIESRFEDRIVVDFIQGIVSLKIHRRDGLGSRARALRTDGNQCDVSAWIQTRHSTWRMGLYMENGDIVLLGIRRGNVEHRLGHRRSESG